MTRLTPFFCAMLVLLLAKPVRADADLDALARDVDRVESVRAAKNLQATYVQYAQYGLWNEAGALFARDGGFVFDGMIEPAQTARGVKSIAAFLRTRYGGGYEGVKEDGLSTMFIDAPVVNLSPDGTSARARWQALIFHGHGGEARIEGGVFENDYVRERGVWKIETAHYYPQFDGPDEEGWTNWGGGDLPVVPKHFDVESAGIPIPPATGMPPKSGQRLRSCKRASTLSTTKTASAISSPPTVITPIERCGTT